MRWFRLRGRGAFTSRLSPEIHKAGGPRQQGRNEFGIEGIGERGFGPQERRTR
jgi:hypothetical protein